MILLNETTEPENVLASKELASVDIPFRIDEDLFYLRKWLFYKEGKEFATSNDFKNHFLHFLLVKPIFKHRQGSQRNILRN
ncbi:hypothetical protein SAMN04488055_3141 [Chitinophaga niabensis]|uniref:Uncharacterized protein n=1 Tax=Chitinophaga niabensis TaxID=536979 RepID=A0A1N6H346_9BACT|nr:hypothetical protein SAMN04488055_3141 [Chitinophaga niabensis]